MKKQVLFYFLFLLNPKHESGKYYACCEPCKCGDQCTGQSVARFGDFCGQIIDTHCIEDGFGACHTDGCDKSGKRVSSVFFENVKKKSGCRR